MRILTFLIGEIIEKSDDLSLEIGDLVVYPIYGVGEIENFDTYDVDGSAQDFILINFKQDKMKLRIPEKKPLIQD